VGRATGRRGLVELAEGALVVVLVRPAVLAARGAELTGGLNTTRLVRCERGAERGGLRREARAEGWGRGHVGGGLGFIGQDGRTCRGGGDAVERGSDRAGGNAARRGRRGERVSTSPRHRGGDLQPILTFDG
jgi:hypothetical protein